MLTTDLSVDYVYRPHILTHSCPRNNSLALFFNCYSVFPDRVIPRDRYRKESCGEKKAKGATVTGRYDTPSHGRMVVPRRSKVERCAKMFQRMINHHDHLPIATTPHTSDLSFLSFAHNSTL
jgi:hypothetical protein